MIANLKDLIDICIEKGHKRDVTNVIYFWKIAISEELPNYMKYSDYFPSDQYELQDAFLRIPFQKSLANLFMCLWKEVSGNGKSRCVWEETKDIYPAKEKTYNHNHIAPEGTHTRKMQDIYVQLVEVWDKYDLEWKNDY